MTTTFTCGCVRVSVQFHYYQFNSSDIPPVSYSWTGQLSWVRFEGGTAPGGASTNDDDDASGSIDVRATGNIIHP